VFRIYPDEIYGIARRFEHFGRSRIDMAGSLLMHGDDIKERGVRFRGFEGWHSALFAGYGTSARQKRIATIEDTTAKAGERPSVSIELMRLQCTFSKRVGWKLLDGGIPFIGW
jgi:hypothetical protein